MSNGVLIASRTPPVGVGGLAEYQRQLAIRLPVDGRFLACVESEKDAAAAAPAWPVTIWPETGRRALWMSLASRPLFHPLLLALVRRGYRTPTIPLPSAVHFVGTGWDFFGFRLAAFARRHGIPFTIWPAVHAGEWGDDVIDLRLYREADALFCQSDFEADHLVGRGLPRARVVRCGLPPMCDIGADGAAWRTARGIPPAARLLFFLGRRDAGKGYPALLAAWPRILSEVPDARLLVAGPGDPLGAAALPGVHDLGVLDQPSREAAYAACDVFCLPSAHESFGIVFVEAWSFGKPVICGTALPPREWIVDGVNGLHASQDPSELAAASVRLLSDPALAVRLGAAGRTLQRERFTWENVVASHLRAWNLQKP